MVWIASWRQHGVHEVRDVEAIPMYVEELLLLLTCYVEGTS